MARNTKITKLLDYRKSKTYVATARQIITSHFITMKEEMIEEFNNHPVTIEIEAGPEAKNISGTISGEGNLFGFIGFEKGSNPTRVIRNMLTQKTFINNIIVQKNGNINTVVAYPSARDIFERTPLPWAEGRSWAEGIERGLPGLGFYMHKDNIHSRSGAGIQSKTKLESITFRNTSYISAIIKRFEKKMLSLNTRKIL